MTGATTTEDTPERALRLSQLEHIQLENEKLKLELVAIRKRRPWYHILTQMVPLITAFVAIAGFCWGIVQYRDQQTKNRLAQESQSSREAETAEREFMKPWLESQRETYLQALSAVATVANSDDPETQKQATEEFWQLYQGKMILVETTSVSGGMVHFGHCLDGKDTCDRKEMNARCRALATAMAESMAATAKMTFKEFVDNKFRYTSGPQKATDEVSTEP